jgi:hypothetical protein
LHLANFSVSWISIIKEVTIFFFSEQGDHIGRKFAQKFTLGSLSKCAQVAQIVVLLFFLDWGYTLILIKRCFVRFFKNPSGHPVRETHAKGREGEGSYIQGVTLQP